MTFEGLKYDLLTVVQGNTLHTKLMGYRMIALSLMDQTSATDPPFRQHAI